MRHDELLRQVRALGCHLLRQSKRHEIYTNPSTSRSVSIPRDEEVSEVIARLIRNHLGTEDGSSPLDKSSARVQQMFGEIAGRYDLLNRVLSLGIDRWWRRRTVKLVPPEGRWADPGRLHRHGRPGFGLLAGVERKNAHRRHRFLPTDVGRRPREVPPSGAEGQITLLEADTLRLPFADDTFQIVCVAFGLRNVSDTDAGLREMTRVCRPGGRVAVLEFSTPSAGRLGTALCLVFPARSAAHRPGTGSKHAGGLQLSSAERRPLSPRRGPGRADASGRTRRGAVPAVHLRRRHALRGKKSVKENLMATNRT